MAIRNKMQGSPFADIDFPIFKANYVFKKDRDNLQDQKSYYI